MFVEFKKSLVVQVKGTTLVCLDSQLILWITAIKEFSNIKSLKKFGSQLKFYIDYTTVLKYQNIDTFKLNKMIHIVDSF